MIGHRQRIAIVPVARLELPFEICGPHLVRVRRLQRGCAGMRPLVSAPILSEQMVPVEERVERTACRPRQVRMPRAEHLQQFLRAPTVLVPCRDDERFDLVAGPMRARMRRSASLHEPAARCRATHL
jgi:hypothetical protein